MQSLYPFAPGDGEQVQKDVIPIIDQDAPLVHFNPKAALIVYRHLPL
jgi:hypothetical protein